MVTPVPDDQVKVTGGPDEMVLPSVGLIMAAGVADVFTVRVKVAV